MNAATQVHPSDHAHRGLPAHRPRQGCWLGSRQSRSPGPPLAALSLQLFMDYGLTYDRSRYGQADSGQGQEQGQQQGAERQG